MAPSDADAACARLAVEAHDAAIWIRRPESGPVAPLPSPRALATSEAEYERARAELASREAALAFDHAAERSATPLERRADAVLRAVRARDDVDVYAAAAPRRGWAGQSLPRFAGDHFLVNADDLIPRTGLFRIAARMPKGAHLHVHFNACLQPRVLLDIAKRMDRMHVTSDVRLERASLDRCRLQFAILPPGAEQDRPGDLFAAGYEPRSTMSFADLRARWPEAEFGCGPDEWLSRKLTFCEEETHNGAQTAEGAWDLFNGRTQMMKGLFNYETAFREYTRLCIEDFARDNIQYAEIRPNFMKTNQLRSDDGTRQMDNAGMMEIIVETATAYLRQNPGSPFRGLKVIYCTPRIFDPSLVAFALDECIEFKQRWPGWIAGFDLVGEESKGRPLREFAPQLLAFRRRCAHLALDIPLLLHCGETDQAGGGADGNLLDALLLGARRIGHGYALARHPYVMDQMRARGVCVELCPISNEVLGLTSRVGGHAMWSLLASGVHCTVSSDNGTLFRSSLSHDFYQVMVGRRDMGLAGWKQLAEWSLEHACLEGGAEGGPGTGGERAAIRSRWEAEWEAFLGWVVDEFEGGES